MSEKSERELAEVSRRHGYAQGQIERQQSIVTMLRQRIEVCPYNQGLPGHSADAVRRVYAER